MNSRKEILQNLINGKGNISDIANTLKRTGWDSDKDVVTLTRANIISVLEKFIRSTLSLSDIERWADTIEAREDIGYENGYEDLIKNTIFELANPSLSRKLTINNAQALIQKLKT